MIDFPANPTVGQVFTSGSQSWTYDGTKWVASGVYVGPPQFSNDNRIINGDMRIDQRNNGGNVGASGYVVDRWFVQYNVGVAVGSGRNLSAIGGPSGFPYYLGSQGGATPHAMAAGEYYQFVQPIEADAISDFQFGTANAQPITLSFWAWANGVSGTFGGAIRNGAATRSYPFTYPMAANTWTRIVVAIPGDTGGTWPTSGNGIGLIVGISLGQGSTYSGPANVWSSGNYQAPNGAVNCLSVAAGGLWITGVKLEIGGVATPFNRQSLAKSMADCQRYYTTGAIGVLGYANGAANVVGSTASFPARMRAAPSITPGAATVSISITGTATVDNITVDGFRYFFTSSALAAIQGLAPFTASAEL